VQHEEGYAKMVIVRHAKGCILANITPLETIKLCVSSGGKSCEGLVGKGDHHLPTNKRCC